MFTEKCLQILSRKKASGGNEKHRNKMRQMMDNIIDKYKSSFSRKMEITPPTIELSQTNSQSYNKMVAYEDKIEVYRTIRSTEIPKQTKPKKQKYLEWREKPDITGVRINKLLKS